MTGSSDDESGVRWPVVWDASAGPVAIDTLPVPVPGFVSASAKIISRGPSRADYVSGCAVDALDAVHPLIWRRGSGETEWIAEPVLYIPSTGKYEPRIAVPPLGESEARLDTVGTVLYDGSPSEATLA